MVAAVFTGPRSGLNPQKWWRLPPLMLEASRVRGHGAFRRRTATKRSSMHPPRWERVLCAGSKANRRLSMVPIRVTATWTTAPWKARRQSNPRKGQSKCRCSVMFDWPAGTPPGSAVHAWTYPRSSGGTCWRSCVRWSASRHHRPALNGSVRPMPGPCSGLKRSRADQRSARSSDRLAASRQRFASDRTTPRTRSHRSTNSRGRQRAR
jgi:hypothetical protein